MIAVHASTWIAFLQGNGGGDAERLDKALRSASYRAQLGLLAKGRCVASEGIGKRRKVRLGDALIAQGSIDQGVALLTRDRDFKSFAEAAGLDLVIRP